MKQIVPINRSKLHARVLELAKLLYPNNIIQNEVPVVVPGRMRGLPVDIIIRDLKVAIECHGAQHFSYTPHFHRVPEDFTAQKQRDEEKAAALKIAGWSLVIIRWDEIDELTRTKLAKKILKAIQE